MGIDSILKVKKQGGIKLTTIEEAVRHTALTAPNKTAVIDRSGVYSYSYVAAMMARISNFLTKGLGLAKGERVMAECTQDAVFLILSLACHFSRLVFVPVERNTSLERSELILSTVKPALFVHENDRPKSADVRQISYTELLDLSKGFDENETEKEPFDMDELCEILYTTGTTGTPKGIMLSHKNNAAIAENIICATKMSADNIELVPLPLSHSHGLRTCYANLLNGSAVVLFDGVMDAKSIYNAIGEYKINALDLSPSAAKILLKLTKGRLSDYREQIRFVELGTALLDEETKAALKQTFPHSRLYNFYGSTEAGRCCCLDFNSGDDIPFCIGYPSKNASFIVCDGEKNVISSSKENTGLLAVTGAMNMLGYWGDKAATDAALINGYIYSNDLSYIDEAGRVFVLGRADDVINYKGIKISPEEIEAPAMKYFAVADCACVAIADKLCGQAPKLFVQPKEGMELDKNELTAFLKDILDETRMPKIIEIIDRIPRSSNGKLLRKQLRG